MSAESPYDKYLVYADFIEGYSVRNLFDYLRHTHKQSNNGVNSRFVFTPTQIRMTEFNSTDNLVNQVIIRASDELAKYHYDESNGPVKFVPVDINELRTHFRNLTKKDGVKICIYKSDPSRLHVIPNPGNRKEQGSGDRWVKILNDVNTSDFQDIILPTGDPSATKLLANFCKECASNITLRCREIDCYGGPDFVEFISKRDGEVSGLKNRSGDPDSDNYYTTKDADGKENKFMIKIGYNIMKALSKMSNITGSGHVRLYMRPGQPLHITTSIGNYGRLIIMIGDKNIAIYEANGS